MNEWIPQVVGYIAAFLTTCSFLPQAIKTIQTKCTDGISVVMYFMFTTGVFLWLVYGLFVKDFIIVLANVVTFVFSLPILLICLRNKFKNEKLKFKNSESEN